VLNREMARGEFKARLGIIFYFYILYAFALYATTLIYGSALSGDVIVYVCWLSLRLLPFVAKNITATLAFFS